MTLDFLIEKMIGTGVLKTPRIIEAFRRVDRRAFVPKEYQDKAYIDEPLSLGFGSTISQPSTVAFMLELLAPAPGENILDIGSGSGWQTALLAHIVSHDDFGRPLAPWNRPPASPAESFYSAGNSMGLAEKTCGHVVGLEHIPELAKESISRLHQFSFITRGIAEIHAKNGEYGYPERAPYQAIIVAAGVREVMPAWKEQLASLGRLIFPKKWSIICMKKEENGTFSEEQYEGYIFVPFIREDDYDPDSID